MEKIISAIAAAVMAMLFASPAFAWTQQECVDWDRANGPGSAHSADPVCPKTNHPPTTPATPQPAPSELNTAAAATAAQQQAALAAARAELNSLQTQMTSLESNQTLTAEQRNQQRTELQSRITSANENINQITNNVRATGGAGGFGQASANGAAGNTTTTTIGGTVYQAVRAPVQSAVVGLPPQIMSASQLGMSIITSCGGDFTVEVDREVVATHATFLGLVTKTRSNGTVSKIVPVPGSSHVFHNWEVVGIDGDLVTMQRRVSGYQAVITNFIVGSSAGSGIAANGQNGALGVSNQGGVQSFGNNIQKLPCGYTETQVFRTPRPPAVFTPPVAIDPAPRIEAPKAPFIQSFTPKVVKNVPQTTCGGVKLKPDERCAYIPNRANAVVDVKQK